MEALSGRMVVLSPNIAGLAVAEECNSPLKPKVDVIVGHDVFVYVARGEGTYRAAGHVGQLRPNTLLAAPAGTFSCEMSLDREIYLLSVRHDQSADEQQAFMPFLECEVSPAEGRRWRGRMANYVERSASGRLDFEDVRRVQSDVLPYVWRDQSHSAREKLETLLGSIWTRLDDVLRLDGLAAEAGYTANYLNDLSREHTGRTLGRWIAEMRMARARAALERTDLPIADVGAACGYDDPAYFSRAFRRAHGVPPATWRIGSRPVDARYQDVTVELETLLQMSAPQRAYSYAS